MARRGGLKRAIKFNRGSILIRHIRICIATKPARRGGFVLGARATKRRSEVAARATKAINEALAGKDDQLLVVTTHGGTARCLLGHLLQLPISHWGVVGGLSNASWSIVQTNPRGWHLVEHNAGSIPEPVFGEESGAPAMPDWVK